MSLTKTREQVDKMRISAALLARCLDIMVAAAKPGKSGKDIDAIAEEFIRDHGAIPAFKDYGAPHNPFPGCICFSRNAVVVHGIPRESDIIDEGDLITIDCGLSLDGWFSDAARLFGVGEISEDDRNMIVWSEKVLNAGIEACIPGNKLGNISNAIQTEIGRSPYYNVIQFGGHAIGQAMHEDPHVANAGPKHTLPILEPGMIFCLEPMLLKTKTPLVFLPDKWTVVTRDFSRATHIEHTVLITDTRPEILTA